MAMFSKMAEGVQRFLDSLIGVSLIKANAALRQELKALRAHNMSLHYMLFRPHGMSVIALREYLSEEEYRSVCFHLTEAHRLHLMARKRIADDAGVPLGTVGNDRAEVAQAVGQLNDV